MEKRTIDVKNTFSEKQPRIMYYSPPKKIYGKNRKMTRDLDDFMESKENIWKDEYLEEKPVEGCLITGKLNVSKVSGNLRIFPGKNIRKNNMRIYDTITYSNMPEADLSHKIHRLSFGENVPYTLHPLDNINVNLLERFIMYQYFIKVVPTIYTYLNGSSILTNQFSVTNHSKRLYQRSDGLPGVFFRYDITPMRVTYKEKRKSFLHFLTGVCAIIGGMYTLASMIDSLIYQAEKTLKRKIELGKLS
jgi:hypothetical protein